MEKEELEQEVSRLRGELERVSAKELRLLDHEAELVRRNVALFERMRFLDHELRGIQSKLADLLVDGVDQ